jgi:DnaJ-class molecular chaperone
VRTLDGRILKISLDEIITPQTVHIVKGEGMPRKANNKEKGDLLVKFNILFPPKFDSAVRQQIVAIL